MMPVLKEKHEELVELCRRFGVKRLEVFGSASGEAFDPERSDIDLLVEFQPDQDLGPWLKHYFEFEEELKKLLGRPVDLVMASAPRNPYFLDQLNHSRKLLYAA